MAFNTREISQRGRDRGRFIREIKMAKRSLQKKKNTEKEARPTFNSRIKAECEVCLAHRTVPAIKNKEKKKEKKKEVRGKMGHRKGEGMKGKKIRTHT